jgi:Cu/Ag efflux protein CusF
MMRKTGVIAVAVIVVLALSTLVMAQERMKITGKVIKIDVASNSVTIQPEGKQPVTIIMKDAASLSKVKEGETAEARYTVEDGKNMGRYLHVVDEGCS